MRIVPRNGTAPLCPAGRGQSWSSRMNRLILIFLVSVIAWAAQPVDTVATWYGRAYHGRKTASGERFDMSAMTAAHPWLPFGTMLKVSWLGREVVVRITDRPKKGRNILDLSPRAFSQLAPLEIGHLDGAVCEVLP